MSGQYESCSIKKDAKDTANSLVALRGSLQVLKGEPQMLLCVCEDTQRPMCASIQFVTANMEKEAKANCSLSSIVIVKHFEH